MPTQNWSYIWLTNEKLKPLGENIGDVLCSLGFDDKFLNTTAKIWSMGKNQDKFYFIFIAENNKNMS